MSPTLIGILALVALVAVALIIVGQRRTRALHEKFGPEYERTLKSMRDRGKAESELRKRSERVEALTIRPLSAADRERFERAWQTDQARFVDDPRGAVKRADHLVADLMQVRGYPVADFEQRAADVSVNHPDVVSEYRTAHDIAVRDAKGQANTEELRKAMVHYRALFRDLVVVDVPADQEKAVPTSGSRVLADSPEPATTGERIIPDPSRGSLMGDRIISDGDEARPDAR
jgi:Sec-independent protein translocase protein TatA